MDEAIRQRPEPGSHGPGKENPEPAAIRMQLEKMLSSRALSGSSRLCRFLRFVVERKLEGDRESIQEYVIGLEVFDRKESFDPRVDSIVRVEARRLRNQLDRYYDSEGRSDRIRIELPRRGYVPEFRFSNKAEGALGDALWKRRAAIPALVLAAVLAAITSWFHWPRRRRLAAADQRSKSIAVLPFAYYSGHAGQEYLADAFTDALTTVLARIRSIRVVSRTSTARYKATMKSAPEIASELNVAYLLEGSVSRSGDRLDVTAQLIDAVGDRHIWAHRYELRPTEVMTLQGELAHAIAGAIAVELTAEDESRVRAVTRVGPEAAEAYLKARLAWNEWTKEGADRCIRYCADAVSKEPDFALAHALLGAGYRQRLIMGDGTDASSLVKATEAVRRALELEPDLAEAHFSLGACHTYAWKWATAELEFQHALRLEPRTAEFHHGYAILFLAPMGRLAEAEREIREAVSLAPMTITNRVVLGKVLYFRGRYEEAVAELKSAGA